MSILFRTHIRSREYMGSSLKSHIGSGLDWSDLREYQSTDSSRDIFWKKINPMGIPHTKIRHDQSQIQIIVCSIENDGDDFSTDTYPLTRREYKNQCIELLKKSAKEQNIPLEVYAGKHDILDTIRKKHIQNTLIFVLHSGRDPELEGKMLQIQHTNDVISVEILQRYEYSGGEPLLFLGKIFGERGFKKYKKALSETGKQLTKNRQKHGIQSIELLTTDNITTRLNLFFKHRYGSLSSFSHYSS